MTSFNIYLTDETKNRYMSDFQKLLNLTNSEFWDIDEGLKETLIRINQNPNYQTLYSKKHETHPDYWNLGGESYLEITTSKNSWVELYDILSQIKSCSNCLNSPIELVECNPHDNENLNPNSSLDIGCIRDPDYFRIKHFKISIETSDMKCHEKFWECIESEFTD